MFDDGSAKFFCELAVLRLKAKSGSYLAEDDPTRTLMLTTGYRVHPV